MVFGVVVLRDALLMFVFLIRLPHLTVLHRFLLPLRSMRISSVELMVREFMRLSMLLLHLSSCRQQGSWLTNPRFFYKRLASLLSAKWSDEYSVVLGWLRCYLGFSLLRSAIQCIRGACSSIDTYTRAPPPMDLVQVESCLSE